MLIFMILMSCGEKVLISPIFHMFVSVPSDNVTEGVAFSGIRAGAGTDLSAGALRGPRGGGRPVEVPHRLERGTKHTL